MDLQLGRFGNERMVKEGECVSWIKWDMKRREMGWVNKDRGILGLGVVLHWTRAERQPPGKGGGGRGV